MQLTRALPHLHTPLPTPLTPGPPSSGCAQVRAAGKKALKEARRAERRAAAGGPRTAPVPTSPAARRGARAPSARRPPADEGEVAAGVEVRAPLGAAAAAMARPPAGVAAADLAAGFAAWEAHGSGVGSRLLRAMGWREGQGLGRAGEGRAEPLRPALRPRGRGLGAGE
jgi:hypothetical protein